MVSPSSPYILESLNPDGFLALRQEGEPRPAPEDFLCEYANPATEVLLLRLLHLRRKGRALLLWLRLRL